MLLCSVRSVACRVFFLVIFFISDFGNSLEPQKSVHKSKRTAFHSREDGLDSVSEPFWEGVRGEKFVTRLYNHLDLEKFNLEHSETFIMFFASWCKSSVETKGEFANVAQEISYTEGYDHIHFGAFDCSANLENKRVCNQTFQVTQYPQFIYFQHGKRNRMYTEKCPRYSEFFYNWVLGKGDENYCSGSLPMAMATSGNACPIRVSSLITYFITLFVFLL